MNLKKYEKTEYPNIYKSRINGTYAVDLSLGYDSIGKRVRTTKTGIKTEKEAKKILSDEQGKLKCKNIIINTLKFSDYIDDYYHWCTSSGIINNESYEKKKSRFDNHIIPYFQNMKLEKIGEDEILNWHDWLNNKNLSQSTKNTIHKQLSAYFNWLLIHKKVINFNPCITVPNFKIPKKMIEYRTTDQMKKLFTVIENDNSKKMELKLRIYAIVKTLFYSGFRIGELMGLKLIDFDFDFNKDTIDVDEVEISIQRTLYYSSSGWVLHNGKTDDSIGKIFIGKNVFQAIFDYVKYMRKIGYILQADDYVFANPESTKEINVFSLETIRSHINYYFNLAGLPHTRPKDMRSSHGTLLLSNGFSLEEVQIRLRHSKKETTEKYYATFYEEAKKKIASEIDKLTV